MENTGRNTTSDQLILSLRFVAMSALSVALTGCLLIWGLDYASQKDHHEAFDDSGLFKGPV